MKNTAFAMLKTCTLAAAMGLAAMQAQAGDGALYAKAPGKDEASVRIYNASGSEVSPTVGSTSFTPVGPQGSSAFEIIKQGDYTANLGSQSLPVKLDGGKYYTLVTNAGGAPKLVEDPPFKNKQKSLVRVQNLTGEEVSLKTADGKDVVPGVKANGKGEREVNPVKVSLALYKGSQKVADVKPVSLERGEASVLFVTGSGSSLSPVWVNQPVAAN